MIISENDRICLREEGYTCCSMSCICMYESPPNVRPSSAPTMSSARTSPSWTARPLPLVSRWSGRLNRRESVKNKCKE